MTQAPTKLSADSSEAQKIENLKRQVLLLETENSTLRDLGVMPQPGGVGNAGVDQSIRHLRQDYARTEAAYHKREVELTAKTEALRKEALAAKLRERRAVEEMAEAKKMLAEQREKFSATRQELTAEVVAYQRDLDELLTRKRQLEADLTDAVAALQEREQFVSGFDSEVRMLRSHLEEKHEEAARAVAEASGLRVELNEERVKLAALQQKYDTLRSHQGQVEAMRATAAGEAERAAVELRQLKVTLDAEAAARHKADDDKMYLVREAATLESTIQELTATADFISAENVRLKRETSTNKVRGGSVHACAHARRAHASVWHGPAARADLRR